MFNNKFRTFTVIGLTSFSLLSCTYNDDLMAEYNQDQNEQGDVKVESSHSYRNENNNDGENLTNQELTRKVSKKKMKERVIQAKKPEDLEDLDDETQQGPAANMQNTTTQDEETEEQNDTYTIKQGDTIYSISRKFGVKVSAIIQANKLSSSGFVKIGQKLKIPNNSSAQYNQSVNTDNNTNSSFEPSQEKPKQKADVNKNEEEVTTTAMAKSSPQTQQSIDTANLKTYKIQQGDTLYSMSRRFGVKINEIATLNNIKQNQVLKLNSTIYLPATANIINSDSQDQVKTQAAANQKNKPSEEIMQEATSATKIAEKPKTDQFVSTKNEKYIYPINSKIVSSFGKKKKGLYNDGILFEVKRESNIVAAKSGSVFHASFLKNYNNLVIIKHEDGYLTVYGNLDKISVSQGQKIQRGQKIATVSPSVSKTFYFSVRGKDAKQKPIDPMNILN